MTRFLMLRPCLGSAVQATRSVSRRRTTSGAGKRHFRPHLETLESRTLPAITTLRIENTLAFPRLDEPVTSGVPIPESLQLLNTNQLRILDNAGQLVPAQFRVLGLGRAHV